MRYSIASKGYGINLVAKKNVDDLYCRFPYFTDVTGDHDMHVEMPTQKVSIDDTVPNTIIEPKQIYDPLLALLNKLRLETSPRMVYVGGQ